jgi:hypothetical protein
MPQVLQSAQTAMHETDWGTAGTAGLLPVTGRCQDVTGRHHKDGVTTPAHGDAHTALENPIAGDDSGMLGACVDGDLVKLLLELDPNALPKGPEGSSADALAWQSLIRSVTCCQD